MEESVMTEAELKTIRVGYSLKHYQALEGGNGADHLSYREAGQGGAVTGLLPRIAINVMALSAAEQIVWRLNLTLIEDLARCEKAIIEGSEPLLPRARIHPRTSSCLCITRYHNLEQCSHSPCESASASIACGKKSGRMPRHRRCSCARPQASNTSEVEAIAALTPRTAMRCWRRSDLL